MFVEDLWLEGLKKNPPEIVPEAGMRQLCRRVKCILMEENNAQPVSAPVTICGDIHGQYYDLLWVLHKLFNADGFLRSVVRCLPPTTFSSVTMWTEDTTP